MALLEKLESGNVYLVKISASNQAGDGPFSSTVELLVRAKIHHGKNPRHADNHAEKTGTQISSFLYDNLSTSHASLPDIN